MPYRIDVKPSAVDSLARLPKADQRRIAQRIDALAHNPRPPGVVMLAGPDELYRIRAGNYRVVYSIFDDRLLISVIRIAHRKDVYR